MVATEATRTAINVTEFTRTIQVESGWAVTCLPKDQEASYGVWGVASSFKEAEGLVMDLGGGSTQLNWIKSSQGECQMSVDSGQSLPYGAARVSGLLAAVGGSQGRLQELKIDMEKEFKLAYQNLQVPKLLEDNARDKGGFTLYLSGGGFRGWGNLLMSQHQISPYPIPIINGFGVSRQEFEDTVTVQSIASQGNVFRISKRRKDQVPAVAFLISILTRVLPAVREVRFCQGE